ncbi:MAG: tetratricopeptide repeat protein [Candidatus Nitrohelix vancouverensis]|uniref:Tetratricopeptide repeat protein n=1 Tax=Candidatus Nitrohelix vancouverensis TaxID=2705534 RepID=A0A7T0C2L8_9BACT|nr:MAG: tetratricopeptide repeat protein [Candidatus Nitrohelix vancouverensis]
MENEAQAHATGSSRIFLLALFLLVVGVYANTWNAPFNYDDFNVVFDKVENQGEVYTEPFPLRYRHVFYLTFWLNYQADGTNPQGYHLVNTLIHALASIVVFFLTRLAIGKGTLLGLGAAQTIAALAAILFALHPLNTEAVAYISGRGNSLSGLFCFLSVLCIAKANLRSSRRQTLWACYFLSFVFFVSAMLSKETAIFLPIGIFIFDVAFMRGPNWRPFRERLIWVYAPVPLLGFLALTASPELAEFIAKWSKQMDPAYALRQIPVIGYAFKLLLLPINLSFDHAFPETWFARSYQWSLLLIVLIASAWITTRAQITERPHLKIIPFGIAWILLAMAPTHSFLPRLDLLSERNLYTAGFGASLVLATLLYLCGAAFERMFANRGRALRWAFLLTLPILFSALTVERNLVYRSQASLWQDVLDKAPGKPRALHNLGHFYLKQDDYENAYVVFNKLSIAKTTPFYLSQARANLGLIYQSRQDINRARQEFEKAIDLDPTNPLSYYNLGTQYANQQQYSPALDYFLKAEERYRNYRWGYAPPSHLPLYIADVRFHLQHWQLADQLLIEFQKKYPEDSQSHNLRARIHIALGNDAIARRFIAQLNKTPALQLELFNELGLHFIKSEQFDEAAKAFKDALRIDSKDFAANYNLGKLLSRPENQGKFKEQARNYLEQARAVNSIPEMDATLDHLLKNLAQ